MELPANVLSAALAGLLHDVGKFAQRAGERGSRTWDTQAQQDFKYLHALLTADFIDKYVPPAIRIPIKNAASNHHVPDHRLARAVALADRLSAGERADLGSDERSAQPRQLLKIFCDLSVPEEIDGHEQVLELDQPVYWPLEKLSLDDRIFFQTDALAEAQTWKEYERLWQDFTAEAAALREVYEKAGDNADLAMYLENMLLLEQRYTWCMPSAYYKARPDISLYDHARMTAALACILENSRLSEAQLKTLVEHPEEGRQEVALLVGGDLSGMQDFLYTISQRGATSALRGRSFYLQLLGEACMRYLLRALGLPITNLIYVGGGNFYLLVRPDDIPALQKAQAHISRTLLAHHQGDLYLALAWQPLQARDFFNGEISKRWRELGEALQRAKQRRFSELSEEDLGRLFQPRGHGGNEEKQCQVCGVEHPKVEVDKKAAGMENQEGVRKCPACASYETLGKDLRQAAYLVFELVEPVSAPDQSAPGGYAETLRELGLVTTLVEKPQPLSKITHGPARLALALADKHLAVLRPDAYSAIGRKFLTNVTPILSEDEARDFAYLPDMPETGSVKPFHVLEAQAQGTPRLGVLRMDVDNLGRLFSDGLGERATLSRIAALSSAFSLFFEGWVGVLAERRNAVRHGKSSGRLYAIYSGGDDLFFVGSWDEVVELGVEIRRDLGRYAAGHPGIHASAGIVLVDGKYPLAQAAQDAGEAEAQAKGHQWLDSTRRERSKDAVTFLGQALPWGQFGLDACDQTGTHSAHALMHLLTKEIDKSTAMPLVRRLTNLHARYLEAREQRRKEGRELNSAGKVQALWGPWNWLSFYSLSRMARQRREESAAIKELRDQLQNDGFRSIEWAGLAARWAELILRSKG